MMSKIKYIKWKKSVLNNIYKIIRNIPNYIENELEDLYKSKYHPYTASIIIILKTEEYKKGKIYHSFVIPYNSKIVIYNV